MPAGKGYGSPSGASKFRGAFSHNSPNSPAPEPKKASSLTLESKLRGKDAASVRSQMKEQAKNEDLRGRGM
jgi:hypothetical protein